MAVAVLSLALGIGAGTAIFSLVNAILLRSLPVPNPHELRVVRWSGTDPKIGNFQGSQQGDMAKNMTADSVSYPVFRGLREQCAAQAEVFGFATLWEQTITARARREAFPSQGLMVSDNFFSGLGVRPLLGRPLGPQDDGAGAEPVTVIAYGWWEKEFDLDPAVLGQLVILNGHSFTIVGVLPREFPGVDPSGRAEFYVPMSAQPQLMSSWPVASPDHWWVRLMARKKPGVNDAQLQAAIDVAFAHEAEAIMKQPKILMTDGRGGFSYDRDYYRTPLLLLLGIVGVVILVACVNLAGLSLARGAARQHELAVRAAIGAGRWPLARQSLVESVLISLLSGALGIAVALWGKTAVSRLLAGSPDGLHYDTSLDLTVLGFTLLAALATAVLSGLLPAIRAGRVDPLGGLKERAAPGAPRLRAGRVLVAAQVALSMLLLTGAGLYVRTLVNLVRINPGFATENLLLFKLLPRTAGYRGPKTAQFYDEVQRAMTAIPGMRSVTLMQNALLAGGMSGGSFFTLPGHSFESEFEPQAHRLTVSETFFATMGIPVLLGRELREADREGAPKVVVVNETFARKYFPAENPLGQTLKVKGDPSDWQVVGVCRDTKYTSIKKGVPPTVYFSFRQDAIGFACFAVRTALPPMSVVPAACKAIAAIDLNVPLADVTTQMQVRDKGISQERLFAFLCSALALLAVLLSCIGLYGLMAYNVARRTREIGVRIALGATRRNVAWPILREALVLGAVGVAVGGPIALALTQLIKSQFYGVGPTDPVTLMGAGILLVVVTIISAWLPARRAARIDPMVALRCE
jgi:predicted permease